jgi:hypothetical protein
MLSMKDFALDENQTYHTAFEEHMLLTATVEGIEFNIMRLLTKEDDFTRSYQLNIDDEDRGSYSSIRNCIEMCNEYIKDHKLEDKIEIAIEIQGGTICSVRSNRKDMDIYIFDFTDEDGEELTGKEQEEQENRYRTMVKGMYSNY